MTFEQFRGSLSRSSPPKEFSLALVGLWWDAKGDWTKAHESAQQDEGAGGSWVHAYLHRKEGDNSNAAYWYSKAGRRPSQASLDEEREEITKALLSATDTDPFEQKSQAGDTRKT